MGVLASKLFTEGDPITLQKLEDCAQGRPNEAVSHSKWPAPTPPPWRYWEGLVAVTAETEASP